MKLLLIFGLCSYVLAEAPYPPSGWRPNGPAFELPPRKISSSSLPQISPPQNQYGPPLSPQKQYGPPPSHQSQYSPPTSPQKQSGPPFSPQTQYGAPEFGQFQSDSNRSPQENVNRPQQFSGAQQNFNEQYPPIYEAGKFREERIEEFNQQENSRVNFNRQGNFEEKSRQQYPNRQYQNPQYQNQQYEHQQSQEEYPKSQYGTPTLYGPPPKDQGARDEPGIDIRFNPNIQRNGVQDFINRQNQDGFSNGRNFDQPRPDENDFDNNFGRGLPTQGPFDVPGERPRGLAPPGGLYDAPSTTARPFRSTRKPEVTTRNEEDIATEEEEEVSQTDNPNNVAIAVANAGQYYVLQPDGRLQKVTYKTEQTEEDLKTNGFSARLMYRDVEPIREPIYTYDNNGLGPLVRINK